MLYQGYFDAGDNGIPQIQDEPASWAVYRAKFGAGGPLQGVSW